MSRPTSRLTSRLVCTAELANLPALLALVDELCRREGVDPGAGHDLRLIAEEACVNVMHHAYPAGQAGPIALELRIARAGAARCAVLTLSDQGRPFDPLSIPAADTRASAEARAPGGLGVHLIRQLTSRQHYQRHPRRGNVLTLEKQLTPTLTH